MSVRQGYLLGIGTNVDPERNTLLIIDRLRRRFGEVLVSRVIQTDPVGMSSQRQFSNFCAFVETTLEPRACKAACVAIEVELGRDRAHPMSKVRDRPADIDLLVRVNRDGSRTDLEAIADYLAEPAAELLAILWPQRPGLPSASVTDR